MPEPDPNNPYRGLRVVVTGAASGMGDAATRRLVDLGAEVIALDLRVPHVPVTRFVELDLRDPASIDAAVDAIDGPIDSIFNVAGVPPDMPALDIMAVNFLGARAVMDALAPRVVDGGSILAVASVGGNDWRDNLPLLLELVATPGYEEGRQWCIDHPDVIGIDKIPGPAYRISKEALVVYVMTRCADLGRRRVRINALSPGNTSSPFMPRAEAVLGVERLAGWIGPLGRYGTPDEQAIMMLHLNDPRATNLTGSNVVNDGGATAGILVGATPHPRTLAARPREDLNLRHTV